MKYFTILLLVISSYSVLSQNGGIVFTENKSQYPASVLFKSDILGGTVFLEKECLTYVFHGSNQSKPAHIPGLHNNHPFKSIKNEIIHSYKVLFVNYNNECTVTAQNQIEGYENRIKGNNPLKWCTHIKSYNKVIYHSLWKGIDLIMYQNGNILKYDFVVYPGADPNVIKLQYEGIDSISITQNNIVLKTKVNQIVERKPVSYQYSTKSRDTVQSYYVLDDAAKKLSYRIYKYDKKRTLFIDPELIFSTYTGAVGDNWGFTATFDNEGNVYSGGINYNPDGVGYPVSLGAFQQTNNGGDCDIAIIKYDPTGTKRLYATYLGGIESEFPHSMVVNSRNELIVYGTTSSPDFPMKNAYDNIFKGGESISYDDVQFPSGSDLFVVKLSPDGSNLMASTFIGGSKNDGFNMSKRWDYPLALGGNDSLLFNYGDDARGEVIVDKSDNVFIGTCTFSSDFPIVGGFQSKNNGKEEGVVMKLKPDLSNIIWSSYMGGTGDDAIYSIDIDFNDNVYIAGGTNSTDLHTTPGTFHPTSLGGSADAFVAKIKSDGTIIDRSTYWGSTDYDQAYFVRVDKLAHIYIYGQTRAIDSTLLINATYGQPNSGQFVSKFNNTLDTVIWSTVFGTGVNQPNISPTAMSVDVCNRVYLAGVGREWPKMINTPIYDSITNLYKLGLDWDNIKGTKNMPLTPDAYQTITDGQDFYFMVIDNKASMLDYATFFGEQGSYYYEDPITGFFGSFSGCPNGGKDHVDGGTSRFDKVGNIYQSVCASCGGCNLFPTYPNPGAWSNNNNSYNCNNATVVFSIHHDQMEANFTPKISICNPYSVSFTNISIIIDSTKVDYTWDFGDKSPKATVKSPTHIYADTGTYYVTLIVKDLSSCNLIDSITYPITITDTTGTIVLNEVNICKGDSIALGKAFPLDSTSSFKWTPAYGLSSDTIPNPYAHPDSTTTYTVVVKQDGCQQTFSQKLNVYNHNFKIAIKQISGGANGNACYGIHSILKLQLEEPASEITWAYDRNFLNTIKPSPDSTVDIDVISDTIIYVKATGKYCGTKDTDSIALKVVRPQFLTTTDTLICKGVPVTITVVNENPLVPLTYQWASADLISQDSTSATFNPDSTTIVHVLGITAEGCFLDKSIIITVDNFNIDSTIFMDITCKNMNDAKITLAAQGIAPFSYLWDNGYSGSFRSKLTQGNYTVTVSDSLGCSISKIFTVTNPETFVTDLTITNASCNQACNGSISTHTVGLTSPYLYSWNTYETTQNIKNKCPGDYFVTITDSHNCSNVVHGTIAVTKRIPLLQASVDNSHIYKSQSSILTAVPFAPDTVSYHWIPEKGLNNPNSAQTVAHPDTTTLFVVYATDHYGCIAMDTVTIFVRDFKCDAPYVFVPNAFTPNEDKVNDILYVESHVVDTLYFAIYTRWGEKVFETNDITKGWDGIYKGEKLSPAVFVYYIDATCINKERLQKKGNISLLR